MLPIWLGKALDPLVYGISFLYLIPIVVLILTRFLYVCIDVVNLLLYTNSPPKPNRKPYRSGDVSIICLIEADDDLTDFLAVAQSWQASNVATVIVVVPASSSNYTIASTVLSNLTTVSYRLLSSSSNEHALVTASSYVPTPLIALTSPSIIWTSPDMIEWLMVSFHQTDIGIVAPAIELHPSHTDRLTLKELAFDMVLSHQNAQLQAYDAFSGTLHSLPSVSLIRTSIFQDPSFQNTISSDESAADGLWRWIIRSRWEFAFQRSDQCYVSIRSPTSWSNLLTGGQFQRRLRRATVVLASGIVWRRHGLLAIRILMDALDVLLTVYTFCCLVLIPILRPAWPTMTFMIVATVGVAMANLISMLVYWSRYPIDLIYLPLYLGLNMARFWAQFVLVSSRSKPIESSADVKTLKDGEKQRPDIKLPNEMETHEAVAVVAVAAAA